MEAQFEQRDGRYLGGDCIKTKNRKAMTEAARSVTINCSGVRRNNKDLQDEYRYIELDTIVRHNTTTSYINWKVNVKWA